MRANNCPPIADRFYVKTIRDDSTGCLLWTGATCGSRLKYGAFTWHGRRQVTAHRAAWMLEVGPIPDGWEVDHLCRVPLCVEITHLEAVPASVNRERAASPSMVNRDKGACSLGHRYDERNTYVDREGKRHCRSCTNRQSREYRARRAALRGDGS